jgi:DNA-binding response OmpR family regulator
MSGYSVLIVEDDRSIADLVKTHLEDMGYSATLAFDGHAGLELARSNQFQLVILDIKLPGLNGIEICRKIRSDSNYIPILMLTSMSTELDRVLGLEMGADDYLTKPFSIRELMARIKALFRRMEALRSAPADDEPAPIEEGELVIDIPKREVKKNQQTIELTAKEFDLLVQFAGNPGRVYTRSELLDRVWGYAFKGYEHTVNTHINRLRAKIEDDPNQPVYICTVWGVGYKFCGQEERGDQK